MIFFYRFMDYYKAVCPGNSAQAAFYVYAALLPYPNGRGIRFKPGSVRVRIPPEALTLYLQSHLCCGNRYLYASVAESEYAPD